MANYREYLEQESFDVVIEDKIATVVSLDLVLEMLSEIETEVNNIEDVARDLSKKLY